MALPDGLPQYTLGWEILQWSSRMLVNPDSVGGDKDARWIYKPDQVKFLLWLYAVNERGEWLYTQAYRERAKGTGKSPMVAAIACAEFLAKVVFSHFECEHGKTKHAHCEGSKAIGKEQMDAVIWLAACSESGTDHTYAYILGMLDGPAKHEYNLDVGATRIIFKGGRRNRTIKQVTASPASLQGPRPTFVICEETQEWTPGKDGPALMRAIILGVGKTNGRYVEVTNAPPPGQGTVAEVTHKQYADSQAGLAVDPGLLFDTFTIHIDDVFDEAQAIPALEIMYADAPWQPVHLLFQRFFNKGLSDTDIRRFYFNELVAPNALWISEKAWDNEKIKKPQMKLKKWHMISLGFKARKGCVAIVATRLDDNAVFVLKTWEKPADARRGWEVPYVKVDNAMRKILDSQNVYSVVASPENYQEIVGRWSIDYEGDVVVEELWTTRNRQKTADNIEQFETAVSAQRMKHDGNETLRRHVMNCFVEEAPQGRLIYMDTPYSSRYIVAAEAAVLSMHAAQVAIEEGALKGDDDGWMQVF